MSLPRRIAQASPFVAGALVTLSLATPAFASVLDVSLSLSPRYWLLIGSLVLLAIALCFRLMRSRAMREALLSDQSDLRWWIKGP
ncbi:MAG: hypothetical protein IT538_01970 [Variibacter sp.]|nr:hypothetical protein [Variibacter sp.]